MQARCGPSARTAAAGQPARNGTHAQRGWAEGQIQFEAPTPNRAGLRRPKTQTEPDLGVPEPEPEVAQGPLATPPHIPVLLSCAGRARMGNRIHCTTEPKLKSWPGQHPPWPKQEFELPRIAFRDVQTKPAACCRATYKGPPQPEPGGWLWGQGWRRLEDRLFPRD